MDPSGTAAKVLEELKDFDLREEGGGKYRLNSPFRPGSNSHGMTLAIENDEHGAWFDHVSHESGSLYDLAQRLGLDITRQVANTKRVYSGLEDYAQAHGITGELLMQAGWSVSVVGERSALAFITKTGRRWRFLDGKKPHYKSEPGYKACWYGLNATLHKRLAEGQPLVICNGEISTVAGQYYGLAAAAVTGGEKGINADLLNALKMELGPEPPLILVAMDCDATGRRVGHLVADQLIAAGLDARAVDLGLSDGGDLADFCMLHPQDAGAALAGLPDLPDEPEPVRLLKRHWYIMPASELKNLPPIEWIIEGEIPARGITVLFGPSGAGKSFLALDYALTIAQDSPVLYMAGEGEYGYQQRVAAWTNHHNKTTGQLYMVIGAVQFLESDDLGAFLTASAAIRPRLVIVDTLARSMVGSDENSTRDMGMFVQACEMIKRELDTAVMLIHHTNKGGVLERGNSALRGASDSMIKVYAQDDLITVESAKTKDARPFSSRYMQIVPVEVKLSGETVESAVMIEAENVFQEPGDPLTQHQEKVLRCLAVEQFGATRQEIADLTAVPYFSLQRVLKRLQDLSYITQSGRGEPYKITEDGRARLDRGDQSDQSPGEVDRIDRIDRIDRGPETPKAKRDADQGDQTDQTDQLGLNFDRIDRTARSSAADYYRAGL